MVTGVPGSSEAMSGTANVPPNFNAATELAGLREQIKLSNTINPIINGTKNAVGSVMKTGGEVLKPIGGKLWNGSREIVKAGTEKLAQFAPPALAVAGAALLTYAGLYMIVMGKPPWKSRGGNPIMIA